MKKERKEQLKKFIQVMEISFHDLNLLDKALTHSSYANENKNKHVQHNERLEFLGDAILDLVVGEYLFKKYPEMPEGELSKARASIVSESPLAACCTVFRMGDYILLGNGELASGGRLRASILADAFEAVVGAIYIDSSYEAARSFILYQLRDFLAIVESGHYGKDYKTVFQEFIQRDGEQKIDYELCREEGPDHDKTFYMEVIVNGKVLGGGSGKTKKDAEQQAAHEALEKLHAL
jgi:ribonuclease III